MFQVKGTFLRVLDLWFMCQAGMELDPQDRAGAGTSQKAESVKCVHMSRKDVSSELDLAVGGMKPVGCTSIDGIAANLFQTVRKEMC
eukprot:3462196-Amphidinium_carterae.1